MMSNDMTTDEIGDRIIKYKLEKSPRTGEMRLRYERYDCQKEKK